MENKTLWDDLIELKNELFYWQNRIEYYKDKTFLEEIKVLELLEDNQKRIDEIIEKMEKAEYEMHW